MVTHFRNENSAGKILSAKWENAEVRNDDRGQRRFKQPMRRPMNSYRNSHGRRYIHGSGLCSDVLAPSAGNLSYLQWYVDKHLNGYTMCCYSRGSWMYLGYAFGRVF